MGQLKTLQGNNTSNSFQKQKDKYDPPKTEKTASRGRYQRNPRLGVKFKQKFRAYSNKLFENKSQVNPLSNLQLSAILTDIFEPSPSGVGMLMRQSRRPQKLSSK